WNRSPKLWDTQTGELLRVVGGHINGVYSVAVSADGLRCLTRDSGWSMNVWDLETDKRIAELVGPGATAGTGCAFADGTGQHAVSGYKDGTLRLWSVALGRALRTYTGHRAAVRSLAAASNGQFAVSGGADGTVMAWPLGEDHVARGIPIPTTT